MGIIDTQRSVAGSISEAFARISADFFTCIQHLTGVEGGALIEKQVSIPVGPRPMRSVFAEFIHPRDTASARKQMRHIATMMTSIGALSTIAGQAEIRGIFTAIATRMCWTSFCISVAFPVRPDCVNSLP